MALNLVACADAPSSFLADTSDTAPARLSETMLYRDIVSRTVSETLRSYSPKFPLWSDGADKKRWVHLPTTIDSTDPNNWVFPKGTTFFKEFSFGGKVVETRMMKKTGDGVGPEAWLFATYRWRDDGLDADLADVKGIPDAAPIGTSGLTHDIPSLGQCQRCHGRTGDPVLGFDATQLDAGRNEHIPHGKLDADDVTNETLAREGLLTVPVTHRQEDLLAPLELAAVGYIHGNCSSCHSPGGVMAELGMDFRYDQLARVKTDLPIYRTAIGVLSTSIALPGTTLGVDSFRILPGHGDGSLLVYRMNERGSTAQMPPFSSKSKDEEAVALLRRWIDGLK